MNKQDFAGFSSLIREENAIFIISRDSKNVRKVVIDFEDKPKIVVTGYSLTNAIKKTALLLRNKENKQICIQGSVLSESILDKMLVDHNIVLSRFDNSEGLNALNIFKKAQNDEAAVSIYQGLTTSNKNVIDLFLDAEEIITKRNQESKQV